LFSDAEDVQMEKAQTRGRHGLRSQFDLPNLCEEFRREIAAFGNGAAEFAKAADLACALGAHCVSRGINLTHERGAPRTESEYGMLAEEFIDPVEQLEAASGSGFHWIVLV
jgi:hypothetical protein